MGNDGNCNRGLRWIIRVTGLFISLLLTSSTFAGTGSASFIFDGSVTNPAGSTPNISISVEWRNAAGAIVSSGTIVVVLAPGDDDDDVRDKVVTALRANAAVAGAFTLSSDSSFGYQFCTLTPNAGNFACTATVMNGNKTGTPPTLVNTVTGLTMSAGVDPTLGTAFFDIEGSPTSGSVEIAANGIVVAASSDGKTTTDIESDLVAKLRFRGLDTLVDETGKILVKNVTVDNLFNLGPPGTRSLEGIRGGASLYVTDPGVGVTSIATQRCPVPVPVEPSRISKIYFILVIALLLIVMGFVVLWVRRRRVNA